jgi:hypothetical protein
VSGCVEFSRLASLRQFAYRGQGGNGKSRTTFEEYVQDRWEMKYNRACDLMQAADTVAKIPELSGVLPAQESHVRELLKIEGDGDRATVWQSVVDRDDD